MRHGGVLVLGCGPEPPRRWPLADCRLVVPLLVGGAPAAAPLLERCRTARAATLGLNVLTDWTAVRRSGHGETNHFTTAFTHVSIPICASPRCLLLRPHPSQRPFPFMCAYPPAARSPSRALCAAAAAAAADSEPLGGGLLGGRRPLGSATTG